ncbi:MAG: hypothetical protein RSE58_06150 [Clostridia bacterium]
MLNERCFAQKHKGGCTALITQHCPGAGQCAFFKPKWMHERDTQRIHYRLSHMPSDKQLAIAQKYYGGKMPWKGTNE